MTAKESDSLRQNPFKTREVEAVPVKLPGPGEFPDKFRVCFDASAPVVNNGEASVTALILRARMWNLDQQRQVINGLARKKGMCPYTKRFVANAPAKPVTEIVVKETDTAFLAWLRERLSK